MSRCVGDRTLWLVSEGGANPEDRAHVASCATCAARLRRLERDLGCLRTDLTGPLPLHVAPTRAWPGRMRWATAAATLAVFVLTVWIGSWWQYPVPPALRTEAPQESVWPFIEGLSMALFATVLVYYSGHLVFSSDSLAALNWSALAVHASQLDRTTMRLAFILALGFTPAPALPLQRISFLRPPLRGPPALA